MTDKVTLKLIHDANLLTISMKGFKIYFALCKFTRDTVILYNTHGQPAIKDRMNDTSGDPHENLSFYKVLCC